MVIKDSFYKNSIALSLTNALTGILRFAFSIMLSNELGAEGMGLFNLIMPVYDLFATIICGGIVISLSRECSRYYYQKQYTNLKKSVHIILLFELVFSIFMVGILILASPLISSGVIGDARALYAMWIMAPGLVFIGLSSAFKGYFYGISKVKVPSIIDAFEKTIRLLAVFGLFYAFTIENITLGVTLVYASLTIGEFFSFILLYIFYTKDVMGLSSSIERRSESSPQLLYNTLSMSVPLCLNGVLTTIISTFSTLLLPKRLVVAGLEYTAGLALIGKFTGMAMPIVYFPMILVGSITMVLIPDLSKNISLNNYYETEKRIKEVVSFCIKLGIITLFVCLAIPDVLGTLFYNRIDIAPYISLLGLSAPFIYLAATGYSMLNAYGKQGAVLKYSIISSVLQLGLIFILVSIPAINISGYGIAILLSNIFSCIVVYLKLRKECYINISIFRIFTDFLLGVTTYYLLLMLKAKFFIMGSTFLNIVLVAFGFVFYFLLSYLISSFTTKKE